MNITCVICSDLFTPSASIYTTPCGHIFHYHCLLHWFENSKTCPQCRAKASPKVLVRLYMNVNASQGAEADSTVLQYKLEAAEFSMKLKERDANEIAKTNQKLKEQNKSLRSSIKELELATPRFESVIAALKDQIKYFKNEAKKCAQLESEVKMHKNRIKDLEHVQLAVEGSRLQVDEIIRNENNVESLALLAATLKKSLIDTDRKKKELQHELRKTQSELSQTKRKMSETQFNYDSMKIQLETLQVSHAKEISFLKDKVSQLKSKTLNGPVNDSFNKSVKRIIAESPINYNRTPVLSDQQEDIIDLSETPPCSGSKLHSASASTMDCNKKDDLIDLCQDLGQDSPLAPSSMGLFAMQRAKRCAEKPDANKFTIFKSVPSSKSSQEPVESVTKYKRVNFSYDGLGGSSQQDLYPSQVMKKPKISKFKKLSADAGKPTRKISEFINIS
ncbi:unnamed protein product [Ceutorhynchus assimilis]|uniref:RING-type domain-containing protein n=1 Tax=Ceutorhynchus assimilis TaxID=467358 RepID=A0A9N9MTY7_9CUCU|nr:unnamed protein product [Ceutorhynchus assimilis]